MTHVADGGGHTFTPANVIPSQRASANRSQAIELTTVQRPASPSSTIGDNFGNGGLSTELELDQALTPIESATTVRDGASVRTLGRSVEAGLASEATLVNTSALPPVDTGFGAWSFLVAAFIVDAIVDGFPLSYGILLNAYLRDEHYRTQKFAMNLLPLIGTLSSGLNYCSSILIQPFISRYPQYRRLYLFSGVVISFVSLYAASYVTKLPHLLLLQGILFGFGSSLVTSASTAYIMSEWFVEKRELANMIVFSGPAAGGVVYPFIISALLRTRTVPETLRVLSFLIPGLCIPFLPFLKGRLPTARVVGPGARGSSSRAWLKDRLFWVGLGANTLQGLGHFVPVLWLPVFAMDLNLGACNAAVVLAVLSGAIFVGQTCMGVLSNHFDPWLLGLSNLFLTCIATFVFWGVLSRTLVGLLVFSATYGCVSGGWSSLWVGFLKSVAKDDHLLAGSLIRYMLFSRGIGQIASTQIAAALMSHSSNYVSQGNGIDTPSNSTSDGYDPMERVKLGFGVGDGRFQNVIVYAGSCFASAAVPVVIGWALTKTWRRGN
ncbi:major facilitator superfamily domain-containing protein [Pterulicium gracile]|uniref:Major facilitator superfamily domain-containing protein n=1 Tax=Pterulicium gracile TaxID=1884261 RepID=A0A5C3QMS0_9AGAR|nr:major facilitator superfamily domain-containing protein [Pterula gracilis]